MKATGIVRNIDELGRIVIPKELRNKMDMPEGSPVEIFVEGNVIGLSRYYYGCHFCGNSENLKELRGKLICSECIKALTE